jgi:type VI secretion system protein ImpJ
MPKRPKPYWFEGPDLDPRMWHYQDEYHEELLEERIATIAPEAWGVLAVEIDEGALRAGTVRFERFQAVMPDGTMVRAGLDADVLPERALGEALARAESVAVYVALPQLDPAAPNMDRLAEANEPRGRDEGPPGGMIRLVPVSAAPAASRVPRYTTRVSAVADPAEGEPIHMALWRCNLRISFGAEPREGVHAIQVAELGRTGAGALELREAFVPAALRVGASRYLVSGLRQVLAAMTAKQQALAASRRQRSASMVEFQAADAARFWLLHTLNTHLPSIADVASRPETHPARAHEKLAALVGALCTFDAAASPTDIPLYDHRAPGPVFERLFAMALALLERLIAERYVQIPLTAHQGDIFAGELSDPALYRHAFFFAVSGGPHTVRQVHEHVPRLAKVAAAGRIMSLVNTATHGAILEPIATPPASLPVRRDVAFFRVHPGSEWWTEIVAQGTIALHLPVPGASVALYAVDPQTLQ